MRNLAELLVDSALQKRVRQSMRHSEPFRSPQPLPEAIRKQLDRLDRVVAERDRKPIGR